MTRTQNDSAGIVRACFKAYVDKDRATNVAIGNKLRRPI
jgi:hypothetical protein